jgi:hypothetical protein
MLLYFASLVYLKTVPAALKLGSLVPAVVLALCLTAHAYLPNGLNASATGSMSSYIAAVQSNVQRIVTEVAASEKCSVRFGLVSYRDHPPQDSSYITKVFDFTENLDAMRANVNTMVRCSQCYPITVSTIFLTLQYCLLTFITLLLYTVLHA